ncbi:MAG: DUF2520 domain-containing protein [Pseudomonadota bacterium]
MRLGVFGGSFNPPHHCHVLAVGLALSSGQVDRVVVIPTHVHPFDKLLAPFDDRMEMCRRAFAIFGDRVEVSDLEARLIGPSYTVETLKALARERPGVPLRLILGTDLLDEVDRWKAFDEVLSLAPPLWIGREGRDAPGDMIFPFQLPDVSSTGIRLRLRTGEAPEGLVPAAVLEHIRSAGLYATQRSGRRILVLGLGRVGSVLARWLAASGAEVRGWDPVERGEEQGRTLAAAGVELVPPDGLFVAGEGGAPGLVIVASPDDGIHEAARIIDRAGIPGDVPAVHCSGYAPVRALTRGARPVGRMHPMFPFAATDLPLTDLARLRLVLEGDAPATAAAADAIREAGGVPVLVRGLDPRRYHAACVMAANHLSALGTVAEELAVTAGVPGEDAAVAVHSLMEAALRNCRRLGFRDSLTGPAARGDQATINGHLDALTSEPAEVRAFYIAANAILAEWNHKSGK